MDRLVRYDGRMTATLVIVAAFSFEIVHFYFLEGFLYSPIILLALIPFSYLGWWLGEQYDAVKYASVHDDLTNAYNRRYILERFPRMAARAARRKEELVLFIIDVNDFKQINDTYGHSAGDVVLKNIANALLYLKKGSCKVVRWGGDEFMALVPVGKRDRAAIGIHTIDDLMQELSLKMKKNIAVSAGQATFPRDGRTLESLVRKADKDMYVAKPKAQSRGIS